MEAMLFRAGIAGCGKAQRKGISSFIPRGLLALAIACQSISRGALLFAIFRIPALAERAFESGLQAGDLVFFLIAISAFAAFHFFSLKLSLELGGEAKKKLRAYFQSKFLGALPIQDRAQKGMPLQELSLHCMKAADLMEPWYSRFLPSMGAAAIVPCAVLAAMFFIDKLTCAILFFTGLLLPLFLFLIGKAAKQKSQEQWQSFARARAFFLESLQGYKTVKIFRKIKERESALEAAEGEFGKKTFAVLKIAFLSALAQELAGSLSIALIAVSLAIRLMNGGLGFETAFLALLISPEFYRPIRQFGMAFHAAIGAKTAWADAQKLCGLDAGGRRDEEDSRTSDMDSPLILRTKNCEYIVSPRNPLYIAGEPGCGKTRLVLEMLGHIEPQGKDAKLIYGGDKSRIAWLPQNPVWLKGSLLDNLCPVRQADFAEAKAALERVNLGHLAHRLYEPVLEYASNFSGGERRRLAIARIILLNRPVWILDEPFAGLDEANVEFIEKLLEYEREKRSIICISHHSGTLQRAKMAKKEVFWLK